MKKFAAICLIATVATFGAVPSTLSEKNGKVTTSLTKSEIKANR